MTQADTKKIAVLGAGSWGTALAILLASNGHNVWLWSHRQDQAEAMLAQGENQRYLPGIKLPKNLHVTANMSTIIETCRNFLVVVPSRIFRSCLQLLKQQPAQISVLAWASKGLENGSGKLLSEVTHEVLGAVPTAVISGPTFAQEVAQGLPTAITVASTDDAVVAEVSDWLASDWVRVYTSHDISGVQLGGAIKNVMAIAAGISDGLGFGANSRAALITRGLAELTRLGLVMGGQLETFMGLTGAGDLILTCTDDQSRNRRLGIALGQGKKLEDIVADLGQEAEGLHTAKELYEIASRYQIEMPITEQVYRVLYEQQAPADAVRALLSRDHKAE